MELRSLDYIDRDTLSLKGRTHNSFKFTWFESTNRSVGVFVPSPTSTSSSLPCFRDYEGSTAQPVTGLCLTGRMFNWNKGTCVTTRAGVRKRERHGREGLDGREEEGRETNRMLFLKNLCKTPSRDPIRNT